MKKLIALLLTFVLALGLLTACGSVTATEETVTCGEDQLERTGIQLYVPSSAENVQWQVLV